MPYKRISDLQDGTLESGSYVPIDKSEGTTQRYDLYELQNVVEGYLYNGTFYADSGHSEAITGEAGKIYLDLPNGDSYRWTGSQYALIARVYEDATTSTHGLMSATDKAKLDGIASGATANSPYTSDPQMDGTASAGSSANFSRGDHVHPTDTTRAPLASPHLTGTPTAPTAASGTNSTQIATTAFTQAEIASHAYSLPTMDATTKGGAKLEEHGGLALRDGALGIGSLVQQSDGYARGGLAEVTAKGHAEQDGTPTPDNPVPIQVVRGRNLVFKTINSANINGAGIIISSGTYALHVATITRGESYIATTADEAKFVCGFFVSEPTIGSTSYDGTRLVNMSGTFTAPIDGYVAFRSTDSAFVTPQLERGTQATPYVPYGHVGMEMRNPDTDELISCTALPLPQRGWVAGLPDGTADSLRLDGAGKCEWTSETGELDLAGKTWSWQSKWLSWYTEYIQNIVTQNADTVSNALCETLAASSQSMLTWPQSGADNVFAFSDNSGNGVRILARNGSTSATPTGKLLYPLATPVTEDCGYVEDWPTDIPEGAVIDIPELDEVGIRYFVDSTVTELAKQWYARANSEYADRLTALEQAVAELATS